MKKKSNRQKQKSKKVCRKGKYALLDTSFQIERLKYENEYDACINELRKTYDIYSSYFVLYEFKVSLVRSVITFYDLVSLYSDPSKAIAKLSDTFGREPKNQVIIQSVLQRIYDSIDTKDTDSYLRKIEVIIVYIQQVFFHGLKGLKGDFSRDEIVRYKIETNDDYKGFVELYDKRKSIPLDVFWSKHVEELQLLLQSELLEKEYEKLYKYLKKISGDSKEANNYRINHSVGDAVIAIDCPRRYAVVSLDTSFSYLCPALGKEYVRVSKDGSINKGNQT